MNRNILDHIKNNHPHQSRYDIDRHLLQQGYDPAEIDHAWRQFQTQAKKRLPLRLFGVRLTIITIGLLGLIASILGWVIVLFMLQAGVGFGVSCYNSDNPATGCKPTSGTPYSTRLSQPDFGGKGIWISPDGGVNWSRVYTDTQPHLIACPDQATCYAVDNNQFLTSLDSGRTWNAQVLVDGSDWRMLRCPDAQYCYAIAQKLGDFVIKVSNDSGQSWKVSYTHPHPADPHCTSQPCPTFSEPDDYELHDIDCPTALTCYVTTESGLLVTSNGGQSWVKQTMPMRAGNLSCPAANKCFVLSLVSSDVLITADSGQNWTVHSLGKSNLYMAGKIVCPTLTVCYTTVRFENAGPAILSSYDDGQTWYRGVPLNSFSPPNLVCFTKDSCLVSEQEGPLVTTQDHWVNQQIYPNGPATFYNQINCPTERLCFKI